jgi:hypothetical protein
VPRRCNDFITGGGAYSTIFNNKRIGRAVRRIGLKYANEQNFGSTWYTTPTQTRLAAYLSLFGMAYLAAEEFSQPEREHKLGQILWPEWHWGVLSMYGGHIALNHFVAAKMANVLKMKGYFDFATGNIKSIHSVLHLHVYHGDDMFSKFMFKAGKYDSMNTTTGSDQVKFFALWMALDGKRINASELFKMSSQEASKKI